MTDFASWFDPAVATALLALRHDLHRHPELAFHEERTASRLEGTLEAVAPGTVRRVAGTGVLARIPGRDRDAPIVAIRGDIDALPISEETGAPFQSVHDGVMHACGHDVHAAWTIGAAHLLATAPAEGDVLILLQPGEETGRGAPAVLETGVLDGVAAIVGAHVDMRFAVGEVVAESGPLAASTDTFFITIVGQGGHAARPHEARDPIVAGAAVVAALQTIVSRRLPPGEPAVVTVGTFRAGSATNVIPERAELSGTARAIRPDTRHRLHDEIRAIARDVATAYQVRAETRIDVGTPPIVNAAEPIAWARAAVSDLLGTDALVPLPALNLGGEDFAFYLEKMAGCFLRIGARARDGEAIPAHTPRFLPADDTVFVGAAVLAETARRASAALAGG
ncbi:MAG TPA: M20 family metallopeptidase [Gemmatimonadales bacterium]